MAGIAPVGVIARSSVAPSSIPRMLLPAPATILATTMARKIAVVPNTSRFPTTIAYPLTALASHSNPCMPCAPNASVTIPASKPPGRNAFGHAASLPLKT